MRGRRLRVCHGHLWLRQLRAWQARARAKILIGEKKDGTSVHTVLSPLSLSRGKAFPRRGGLARGLPMRTQSEIQSPLLQLQTWWLPENSRGSLRMPGPLPQTQLSAQGAIQQHKGLLTGPFSPDSHMPSISKDTGLGWCHL